MLPHRMVSVLRSCRREPLSREQHTVHSSEDLEIGGARGNRTPDLNNAIVTLSLLSYGPTPCDGILIDGCTFANFVRAGEVYDKSGNP